MEWSGVEWSGVEWSGVEWRECDESKSARKNHESVCEVVAGQIILAFVSTYLLVSCVRPCHVLLQFASRGSPPGFKLVCAITRLRLAANDLSHALVVKRKEIVSFKQCWYQPRAQLPCRYMNRWTCPIWKSLRDQA